MKIFQQLVKVHHQILLQQEVAEMYLHVKIFRQHVREQIQTLRLQGVRVLQQTQLL